MKDTRSTSDSRERARVAAAEDYEIDYLVVKTGITREQARAVVRKYGHDRGTLITRARKLNKGTPMHLPLSEPSASGNEVR